LAQRITILSENISNKIAAGEVVERPASVIKELLENALDAGAADIIIETAAGGRRLIKVTDNGHGMSREDAMLSVERHATSKIRNDEDLDSIATLGFRGEALASIASVSRFRLASREPDSLEGTEIIIEGGRVRDVKACGMPPGTVISVEQLFFNTPARLKFMRSAGTESGHIGDSIARMAISRPDVSFTWVDDNKEQLRVQQGDLLRRFTRIIGKESANALHPLNIIKGDVSLDGFISGPATVRSTTANMFTYINGRFIKDRVVQHAIMQAYRGVIDRGRYPVLALFIKLPPGEVDVNVHPTKHEVRFRNQSLVHDLIQGGIEDLLRASPWLSGARQRPIMTADASPPLRDYQTSIAVAVQNSLGIKGHNPTFHYIDNGIPSFSVPLHDAPIAGEPVVPFRANEAVESSLSYFSTMTIIGQFHGQYILCQSGSELVIIDQHAASERVAYQRLQKQWSSGGIESQRLLFSETVELAFSEVATVERFKKELLVSGFELEPFGGNTVIVSAVPHLVAGMEAIRLVRDIIADLAKMGLTAAFKHVLDHLLSRIACHSVIRGVRNMDSREITELLRSMDDTDFAASCPHGRPVSHVISLGELEKIFKRT